MIKIGQIFRDTYFDGKDSRLTHRTIRIVAIEGEKAQVETVTDVRGVVMEKPRKGTVSFKTLAKGYVLVLKEST